jgi:hypothetical protein
VVAVKLVLLLVFSELIEIEYLDSLSPNKHKTFPGIPRKMRDLCTVTAMDQGSSSKLASSLSGIYAKLLGRGQAVT